MNNSKMKIAITLLLLLIFGCSVSHCNRDGAAAATEKNTTSHEVATPKKAIADIDKDGIADSNDSDIDGDGLLNRDEEALNSDPFNKDTDGDGKLDGQEGQKDTDGDGIKDVIESAKNDKDSDGVVDELDSDDNNPANDSDGDGFSNIEEKNAGTNPLDKTSYPQPKEPEKNVTEENASVEKHPVSEEVEKEVTQEIKDVLHAQKIQFEVDSAKITPKGMVAVKKIYEILKKYPTVKMQIAGHTDSDGSAKHNLKLSQDRVDMVKKALVKLGLDDNRFTTKGYGESKPLVPNNSRKNKAINRRVEFIIIGE